MAFAQSVLNTAVCAYETSVTMAMAANNALTSDWHYKGGLDRLYPRLQKGDLLEFYRTPLYRHWAVCVKVDDERTVVVHRSASSVTPSQLFVGSYSLNKLRHGVGSIVEELLTDVLGEDMSHTVRINNSRDKSKAPYFTAMIIKNAKHYMANEDEVGEYNVVSNNCEHFANLCRYGDKESQQVDTAITTVTVGAAVVIGATLLIRSLLGSNRSTTNRRMLQNEGSSDDEEE